jgi:hypothetical protein
MTLMRLRSRQAAATTLVVTLVAAIACGGTTTTPTDRALDGAWTARSFGVAALLQLTWTQDSVKGSGTYTVLDNTLACGGGTLKGSGTVTFRASRSGSSIAGFMTFDNGWGPPYTGLLANNSRIDGSFRSIDAGSCSFPLFFGLIP